MQEFGFLEEHQLPILAQQKRAKSDSWVQNTQVYQLVGGNMGAQRRAEGEEKPDELITTA